jgi:hypothetical protein
MVVPLRVHFLYSSPPSHGTGGDYSFRVPIPDKARVAVFLDFQNVLQRGHDLYGRGKESYQCVPEPSLVADMLASRRDVPSEATSILVFRGRPDPRKEPTLASAHDKQKQQWQRRDRRVTVVSHPLFYRNWPDDAPVEKGIDVSLAIELVRTTLQEQETYDALIVFSSDTDLLPAIKLCGELGGPVVEIACWVGANSLQDRATLLPYCHFVDETAWRRVVRTWEGRV